MEITEILIIASVFIIFLDLMNLQGKKEPQFFINRIPNIIIACVLIIVSYIFFVWSFLTNNFNLVEVFSYSSSGLTLVERLYASWAGSSGSWLFLSFLFATGYLIIRLYQGEDRDHRKIYQFIDIASIFILIIVLIESPLATLNFNPIEGQGLNPLLKTPWMLIHPPIVFIGYVLALFSLSFVFGTAESSMRISRGLAASSWLFLTLGLAIGGLWAYEVLGWGGYWGWDPVETSSLIPWVTLTAYFHLVGLFTGKKSYSQDFMLMITSALILFSSAITRGGLAVSVHAFSGSSIGYVLLFFMVIVISYFVVLKRKKGFTLFHFEINTDNVYNASMSLGFLSLILIGLVSFWGIVFPIINSAITGQDVSINADFFNRWSYPFVLLFLVSLIGCHIHEKLTLKKYTAIIGGLVIIGIILGLNRIPTNNILANFGVPILVFSMGSVLFTLFKNIQKRGSSLLISRGLIHLGTTIIMVGVLIGSSTVINYGELTATPGSTVSVKDISLSFGEFTVINPSTTILIANSPQKTGPESAGLSIPIKIQKGAEQLTGTINIYFYYFNGIVSRPTVIRSISYDFYIVIQQSQKVYSALGHILTGSPETPTEFVISIMYYPLMNLIWVGTLLMSIGIIIPIFNTRKRSKPINQK